MSNYIKLQEVLKEIFEMDKADLDFGIYRIMNQKRDQVMDFVDRKLPKDIKDILSQTQSKDSASIQAELDQMGKSLDDAGVARESAPKYVALKAQLENAVDTNALEQEVFSYLASFFKRYYKDGDFISLRRYKKDVYAIPYEGEEVKLHWANADQYYIKTSEYLKNYAFKLSDGKKVHFQLKEASTEQNNNKTQGDAERRFAIFEDQPIEVVDGELFINFTYEQHKKTVKQDELSKHAFEVIQSNIPTEFTLAFDKAPTEKNKNRTVLEKHLNDFISRNSFDYFIHKDLGGFLSRELDFYIKNEVLYIDDINTENPAYFTAQLSKIKALKLVASKIINFLAQIENFQKKLWLKKKFVISTNYCITLDRIPEKYYLEIASNEAQLTEWKELFSIVIPNGSEESLRNEPFLVVDTKFFSEEFKDKLLAEFDNLEEETNGLLINSENFQALNLMQEKYQEKIDTVYIDPPYNTNATPIVYKNEYKHSSWNSLIHDRMIIGKSLISKIGFNFIAIDHAELYNLGKIADGLYGENNRIAIVAIQHNPKGRNQAEFFSENFEYMLCYANDKAHAKFNMIAIDQEVLDTFTEQDDIGRYRWENFIRARTSWSKDKKPNNWYPLYVNIDKGTISHIYNDNDLEIYPITNTGEFTWKAIKDSFIDLNKDGYFRIRNEDGRIIIEHKYREQQVFKNFWHQKKYQSEFNGTNLIKDILGEAKFSFPKSVYTVLDSIKIVSLKDSLILDYFAGSGTTGHATIKLNREDGGNRKYILVEMGTYFNTVTKPRIQKVIYTDNWKNGQPQDKEGISQIFKYQVLESYEDALNNLSIAPKTQDGFLQFSEEAQEEYLLNYMLDVETQDHLFNIQMFRNPFNYQLKVTQNNELVATKVDLVETFNYLIGLYVERMQRVDDIKFVEGKTREGAKTLIIWRNLETTTNEETEKRFRKIYDSVRSSEFDQIYINGDHHFDNMRTGEDTFKVKLIEETFFKQMFNISEL
ncbi:MULTISPECIES: site-specific DNA-methyltransferase [unclassified Empedobacter]|uniref:site-specific DNA-methyltransferase n=1 Tax=unclassified Empedobacter TaxID=2643773 RepID=UPI0025BB2363|nr:MULTISPECIES: DNA methyltransferase [unclassified Empedobacter]